MIQIKYHINPTGDSYNRALTEIQVLQEERSSLIHTVEKVLTVVVHSLENQLK